MMAAGGRQLVRQMTGGGGALVLSQNPQHVKRTRAWTDTHPAACMCIKLSIPYLPPIQQKNLLVLRTSAVQPEQRGELL